MRPRRPLCAHGTLTLGDPPIVVDRLITLRDYGGITPCDRCGTMANRQASILLRRGSRIAALGLCGPCVAELTAHGLQAAVVAGELGAVVARLAPAPPRGAPA